jgi:lipopolysaccharide biosynthesis glycosyltransferase
LEIQDSIHEDTFAEYILTLILNEYSKEEFENKLLKFTTKKKAKEFAEDIWYFIYKKVVEKK